MNKPNISGLAHVVLRVKELDRSVEFYVRVLGLEVTSTPGKRMAFLSAPQQKVKSHELGLLALGSEIMPTEKNRVGLYHVAWQMDTLNELESFHAHLVNEEVKIVGYGDHGISMGIYFLDPDGNEIEVFYELSKSEWPSNLSKFDGKFPLPFNVERLNVS